MKLYVQTAYLDPEHYVDLARRAEEVGFYGVTVADHLIYPKTLGTDYPYGDSLPKPTTPFPDTWVSVGVMAGATSTIHFASAVYLALLHPPIQVAKAVATAAILSGYRVALGIGLGWMREEFAHVGEDYDTRVERHDEMIEVLRKIWRGGWVEHHGRFYSYEPFRVAPAPAKHIPIWGAGGTDAALRRSARLDGWIGPNPDIPELVELVRKLRGYRAEFADDGKGEFEVMSGLRAQIPTLDDLKLLEEAGVTSLWIHPWTAHNWKGDPGLDTLLNSVEQFGEKVIAKL